MVQMVPMEQHVLHVQCACAVARVHKHNAVLPFHALHINLSPLPPTTTFPLYCPTVAANCTDSNTPVLLYCSHLAAVLQTNK
jgi:hypothetical protein